MSDLFHPNLITTKLIIITAIEVIIFLFIFWLKVAYKEKIRIVVPINFKFTIFSLSVTFLLSLILVLINFIIYQYSSFTLLIFTAVLISILYIEMGIVLSRNFLVKLFDDELPKEIVYFIGFILMINAGYFTIMLILKIVKANSLI
jgi:divalent metal cation (Fe/Co/Zn/Cd) transporter